MKAKRVLLLLLTVLVIASMPVSTFADTTEEVPQEDNTEKEVIDFDIDIEGIQEKTDLEISLDLNGKYEKEIIKEYDTDPEIIDFKSESTIKSHTEILFEDDMDHWVVPMVDWELIPIMKDGVCYFEVENNVTPSIINKSDVKEGEKVSVKVTGNAPKVNHETFDKAHEKNITLEIKGDGYQWTFDPQKVNMSNMKSNFPLDVDVDSGMITSLKKELTEQGIDTGNVQIIRTDFHGEFDGEVELEIKVDNDLKGKDTLNIYYWNEITKKPELLAENVEVVNGKIILNLTHCSRYFITDEFLESDLLSNINDSNNTDKANPDTGAGNIIDTTTALTVYSIVCATPSCCWSD